MSATLEGNFSQHDFDGVLGFHSVDDKISQSLNVSLMGWFLLLRGSAASVLPEVCGRYAIISSLCFRIGQKLWNRVRPSALGTRPALRFSIIDPSQLPSHWPVLWLRDVNPAGAEKLCQCQNAIFFAS